MTDMQKTQAETDRDSGDAVRRIASLPSRRARPSVRRAATRWLECHSITLLRISMGAVILGFGVLKYFPGLSPAEPLIMALADQVTFMHVPGRVAMTATATVECVIGLSLITGWGLRLIIYLVPVWALGILSPAVLMFGRMFSGPDHAPTLEGQYVLKDIILLAAALVIATTVRRSQRRARNPGTWDLTRVVESDR